MQRNNDNLLINLKTIEEPDGKLLFFEGMVDIPFEIKRVFMIYDVPTMDVNRANHASINTSFLLQAVRGSVDVEIDDGINVKLVHLENLNVGLYIPPMIWMKTFHFSREAVLQVYASENYADCEYIEEYNTFIEMKGLVK